MNNYGFYSAVADHRNGNYIYHDIDGRVITVTAVIATDSKAEAIEQVRKFYVWPDVQ